MVDNRVGISGLGFGTVDISSTQTTLTGHLSVFSFGFDKII